MDRIILIWQGDESVHPPREYREKLVLPYVSLEEAKLAWERICEAVINLQKGV